MLKVIKQYKKQIIIVISWILVIINMSMIFSFSEESAVESAETSSGVVKDILNIVMDEEDITPQVVKKYQFPIRKAAHFGIYMLLGFSVSNASLVTFGKGKLFYIPISAAFSVLYAISDEIHQNFSVGRGPSARDVLIDSSGAVIGILAFAGMIYLVDYIRKKGYLQPKY